MNLLVRYAEPYDEKNIVDNISFIDIRLVDYSGDNVHLLRVSDCVNSFIIGIERCKRIEKSKKEIN